MIIHLNDYGKDFYDFLTQHIEPICKNQKVFVVTNEEVLGGFFDIGSPNNKKQIIKVPSNEYAKNDHPYIFDSIFADNETFIDYDVIGNKYNIVLHVDYTNEQKAKHTLSEIIDACSLFCFNLPFVKNGNIYKYFSALTKKQLKENNEDYALTPWECLMYIPMCIKEGKVFNIKTHEDIKKIVYKKCGTNA